MLKVLSILVSVVSSHPIAAKEIIVGYSRSGYEKPNVMVLLLAIPLMFAISAFASGYALSVLWGWFVVPTFNLPPLTVPVAYGLALIVGFLTHQDNKSNDTFKDLTTGAIIVTALVQTVTKPLIALFFGWIVRMFM